VEVYVGQINGNIDQNIFNDSLSANITGFVPNYTVSFNFKTDDYGTELSYIIKDSSNQKVLYSNGSFDNNTGGNTYHYDYCFSPGCYTLNLKDVGNDGYCCGFGNGKTLITINSGIDTLLFDNSFSTSNKSIRFCISDSSTSIAENNNSAYFSIFPNPTTDKIQIELSEKETIISIQLTDINGRMVYESNDNNATEIDLSKLQPAIYFLTVKYRNGQHTEKIVKQ
jgi:hypothetical protein